MIFLVFFNKIVILPKILLYLNKKNIGLMFNKQVTEKIEGVLVK